MNSNYFINTNQNACILSKYMYPFFFYNNNNNKKINTMQLLFLYK